MRTSVFIFFCFSLFSWELSIARDTTYTKTLNLLASRIFSLDPDTVGGIIADISNDGKSSVTISMYYDEPNQKLEDKPLVYQVSLYESSNILAGDPMKAVITYPLSKYIVGYRWTTNQIRVSLPALDNYISYTDLVNDRATVLPFIHGFRPVVLAVTVKGNAQVRQIKFPGFPIMSFSEFSYDFRKVLEAFKNPLKYPDYYIVAAHRGYWKDVPENSLAAYDLTVACGADMVELDTRLTKDNVLVAFHDECLDRITTGTGKLRDYTWDYIKNNLYLKDRFGNPTTYRMVSIEEALSYLKGRAIVNLDIKERITKNADGSIDDQLTPTFKKALLLANSTNTLDQLVIKGKLDVDDLQDVLDDVDIQLTDFLYTPVAFGWDTKDLNKYMNSWLQEVITGIELTYKVSYDPILNFMGKTINFGKRTGIYTFWPEDCNGVIAEDDINNPNNFCKFNYREYQFQNEDMLGEEPSYADIDDNNDLRPGISPDVVDYGGGSYDYLNYKPKKLRKPDFMNDGRGDWDWLVHFGANFIITDRPVLLVEYLKTIGKRNLSAPIITEIPLPDCPNLNNGRGNTNTFTNVRGLVRRISNTSLVEFFTPDTRNITLDTSLIVDKYKQYSNGKTREWARTFMASHDGKLTCADLFADSPAVGAIRRFPMHTLPEWSQIYPGYDLYINSNYFDVKEPWPLDDPSQRKYIKKAPYLMPCTNVYGYWQASPDNNQQIGTLLTSDSLAIAGSNDFDALLLDKKGGKLTMVKHGRIHNYFKSGDYQSVMALAGYVLAENGKQIPYNELPSGISKATPKKRSLIGFNQDTMYVAEFQSPMLEPYQSGNLMMKYFGCTDVFMFDAGGSSTMLSTRGYYPAVMPPMGPNITSGSAPEDRNLTGTRVYRPIANFFAIRVKPNAR